MKRTKYLALVLVVALALMGAGYAAWTDLIQVDTTIETGEFKVDLESPFARVYIIGENGKERIADNPPLFDVNDDASVVAAKPNIENNSLKFEFKNLYPGTRAYTQWYATNNGDISAIVEDINCKVETIYDGGDGVNTLEDKVLVSGLVQKRRPDANGKYTISENIGSIPNGTTVTTLDGVLKGLLIGQEIKPDEQIFFTGGEAAGSWIQFTVPSSLINDEGENEILEIKITMDFIQYNLSNVVQLKP